MTKYWTVLATASLATLLALFATAPVARSEIFKWQYINPTNPSQGKQPSTILCPDGAGVYAVPSANLSNRNLTMAYLIGADLSAYPIYNEDGFPIEFVSTNLTGANLSQAEFTNANLGGATLNGANFTNAEVRGANFYRDSYYGGSGITAAQLYSSASYQAHDLTGIKLAGNNLAGVYLAGQNITNAGFSNATLTNANFGQANLTNAYMSYATLTNANLSQANLTNAKFYGATLTSANLAGAEVRGAYLSAITTAQLYSTASYQAHDLSGIGLYGNLAGVNLASQNLTNATVGDILTNANFSQANLTNAGFSGATLTNANFSQANLTGANFSINDESDYGVDLSGANLSRANLTVADFSYATLTGANLSGADARGANFYLAMLSGANTSNLVQSNGHIAGLNLTSGATLVVRDYDGNPAGAPPTGQLPIVVDQHLAMNATGTLRLEFDADPWDSTISFAPGIPVARDGTLDLTFDAGVNAATQIGRTIDLFDWTGVSPSGTFTVSSPYTWDLSKLYTSGEVTLAAVPGFSGDFNGNGVVDAADYIVWRKNYGTPAGYNAWRTHFGQTTSSGSGASINAAVPEPTTLIMLIVAAVGVSTRRLRTCRVS